MNRAQLTNQWQETKATLLEGLTPTQADIVGKLMENQRAVLLAETAASGSTSASDISGFRKVVIPMIRRIIPGTIATELVGVQAMNAPVGQVYSMRYKYADDALGGPSTYSAGTPGNPGNPYAPYTTDINDGNEAFGNANPLRQYYSGATTAPDAQAAGAGTPGGADVLGTPVGGGFGTVNTSDFDRYLKNLGGAGTHAEGMGGRKMSLEIVSQAIEARTRKLQSSWTIEAMQDMKNGHGMDIETEMTRALSAEIVQEIDAEIISDLIALAGTAASYDGSLTGVGPYTPTFVGDRFANLQSVINYVANEIARKTRRGAGNYIVVSPMIVSVLQSAAKSVFAPAIKGEFKGPNNTQLAGTLNGSIKVYSYLWNQAQPWAGGAAPHQTDLILVGYKGGNGETDSGYFYCPYIPLMSSGVVMNPQTMQPVISLMTRYAKAQFINASTSLGNSGDYYGKVTVTDTQFA